MPGINISPFNNDCNEFTHEALSKHQNRMEKSDDKKIPDTHDPELFP